MGILQTKPQYSRNYLLDMNRRHKLYGFDRETLELFWTSEQEVIRKITKENSLGSIGYIDNWNKWKSQHSKLRFHPNLPYAFNTIYFPDIFTEFLDMDYRLFGLIIPKTHISTHFNSIANFYSTSVGVEHRETQSITSLNTFVNTLLDLYEYSQLVDMIIDKYGKPSWELSQKCENHSEKK
jgi:hypothetical protein